MNGVVSSVGQRKFAGLISSWNHYGSSLSSFQSMICYKQIRTWSEPLSFGMRCAFITYIIGPENDTLNILNLLLHSKRWQDIINYSLLLLFSFIAIRDSQYTSRQQGIKLPWIRPGNGLIKTVLLVMEILCKVSFFI